MDGTVLAIANTPTSEDGSTTGRARTLSPMPELDIDCVRRDGSRDVDRDDLVVDPLARPSDGNGDRVSVLPVVNRDAYMKCVVVRGLSGRECARALDTLLLRKMPSRAVVGSFRRSIAVRATRLPISLVPIAANGGMLVVLLWYRCR